MQRWLAAAAVYRDPRVIAMVFLGFSSGLPFGVLAEPFTAWLFESGVSKTGIGLFTLVSVPYALKPLWAPLMDRVPVPVLSRVLGRRRGWVVLTQGVLLLAVVALGASDPAANPGLTALAALLVAFCSASQDIVIDAYRIEILDERRLAAGAATYVFGWRFAQVGGAAAGLILADLLPWAVVFTGMAVMVLVGVVAILLNPEPDQPVTMDFLEQERRAKEFLERRLHLAPGLAEILAWLSSAYVGPFADFKRRRGWLAILLFILLYKFGDAVLAVMKVPFFLEIGFSKTEIAEIVKIFGFGAIIAGGFLGGALLARTGIMRGLLVCGLLMALSNLVFVAQAWAGHSLSMLALTIAVENITTGMGTVAFIAYLSSLCNVAYTATQYALLTSLMAFSRTVLSSGAGWLADQVDWVTFFVITTVAAAPGLALLLWLMRRGVVAPLPARGDAPVAD